MAKPLRSDDPAPRNVQFSHFGVMNDGAQSKSAFFASVGTNVVVLILVVIVGSVVKTKVTAPKKMDALTLNVEKTPPPKPPPPPKIVPPKPLPQPPKPIEPPKIQPPVVEKPPEIKPLAPVPQPKPVLEKPAPLKVEAPPAPKVVSLNKPSAASVPNNDAHPSAVSLGRPDSPIKSSLTGPAVANVRLGQGMPGMPAGNTGNGPPSKVVNLGNGSPTGTNLKGTGPVAVKGLSNGCAGCTGTGPAQGPVAVKIPTQQAVAAAAPTAVARSLSKPPTVTYKPTPVYTAEAKSMHLEGNVSLKIRVTTSGSVQVLGVVQGLGHGLDQSAIAATEQTRFNPAIGSDGKPIEWEGVVVVKFQLAG